MCHTYIETEAKAPISRAGAMAIVPANAGGCCMVTFNTRACTRAEEATKAIKNAVSY